MPPSRHFLDIPKAVAASDRSHYALLPIPYEQTTSFGKGTKNGPSALIRASHEIDTVDEELLLPLDIPVQTLAAMRLRGKKATDALSSIFKSASNIHDQGRFLLAVGGEHSISAPLIKAAAAKYKDMSVLQFDAHLDLRNSYQRTKQSHASAMRRVVETGISVVHAGIRSLCGEELDLISDRRTPVFFAREMIEKSVKSLATQICRHLSDNVYITFDVDALDPSIMPGTGTPEPGGLDWYMATGLIREIVKRRNVVSADLVELAPIRGSHLSEYTAARLAQKLITYHFYKKQL